MKIILDVMSGDNAPVEIIKGAAQAADEYGVEFIFVGDQEKITQVANDISFDLTPHKIVHTDVVITMDDDPIVVLHAKKESSLCVGLRMLAAGEGDAFVSATNTGALFTAASLIVRKIPGIQRAAIGSVLPMKPPVLLLDSGANITVTEDYMEQFAVMGSAYMRKIYGIECPRVGLLNNGSEPTKGTDLQRAAYARLSACSRIHFIGNVEGNDVPRGACDVVVTDGFTGNILLKTAEGMGKMMMHALKDVFYANALTMLSAQMMKKHVTALKVKFDATEHGGAPLLGISKPVIKAHGSSNAKAFKNAIRQAISCCDTGITYDIAEAAAEFAAQKKREKEAARAAALSEE